jgi:4-hydroxy-4-methyl-2-oxoglutarate aldolase
MTTETLVADPAFEELRSRYLQVYLSAVTDALDRRGFPAQWLGPAIKPLEPSTVIFGWAFTVQWSSNPDPVDPNRTSARMLDALVPDHVAVIDTGHNPDVGYWGELCCNISLRRRVRGVVIDGGLRDSPHILQLGFPAFCRFTSPLEATGRSRVVRYQEPICIGRVAIRPGDGVFGDLGGVVIIPKEIVHDLIEEVESIVGKENRLRRDIHKGISADEAITRYGRI